MPIGSNSLKLFVGGITMGSGACLTYVAPLLLPYIGGTAKSWRAGLRISLIFSLGRALAVAILGGLATVAFSSINQFFPPQVSGYIYLVCAAIMVTGGTFVILGKGFRVPLSRFVNRNVLNARPLNMLLLGFLMGISPCVPLVSVLTYIACVAENAPLGILYALCFAIGAAIAPVVLGTSAGAIPQKLLSSPKVLRAFQFACGLTLVFFGAQLGFYVFRMLS